MMYHFLPYSIRLKISRQFAAVFENNLVIPIFQRVVFIFACIVQIFSFLCVFSVWVDVATSDYKPCFSSLHILIKYCPIK